MKVKVLATVLLLVAVGSSVGAYQTVTPSAPRMALACVKKNKLMLTLRQSSYYYEPVTSYPTNTPPVTSYVQRQSVTAATQEHPVRAVKAFDLRGKEIKPQVLKARLAAETPVLLVPDVKAVDALLLRLLKEDTILLVLPGPPGVSVPATGTPPSSPPPVSPPTVSSY